MDRPFLFRILLLLLLCPLPGIAGSDMDLLTADQALLSGDTPRFSLQGHYKNLFTRFSTDTFQENAGDTPSGKTLSGNLNRLRLSPEYRSGESFLVHADIDNELYFSNYTKSRTFSQYWIAPDYNDLFRPSADSDAGADGYYRLNLHRFYAKQVAGKFTLTLGRQQIRFGSGRLWNPLDILNPVSPTFVEGAEDQKGTDAVRLEYYPGPSTEIALVYTPRRKNDEASRDMLANRNTGILARVRTTVGENDIALLTGRAGQKNLIGADMGAILWDGMLRGSLLYAAPDEGRAYFTANIGYEYSFSGGLYFLIEYFYNENSINHNENLAAALEDSQVNCVSETSWPFLANTFLTANRHYAGLALGHDLTPLIRGDIFAIADIEGRGLFFSPSLKYNALQNLDISVSAMLGIADDNPDTPSDFRDIHDNPVIFTTIQWYF